MVVKQQGNLESGPASEGAPRPEGVGVLLIHGLGSRGSDLHRVLEGLSDQSKVAIPDLRGHGLSDPGPAETIEDFAVDLLPLLDEDDQVLVGFSFGAWVAMELWRMCPDRVVGVILVDPPLNYGPLFEWASKGGTWRWRLRSLARRAVATFRRLKPPKATRRQETVSRLTAIYNSRDEHEAAKLMKEHPLTRDLNQADRNMNALSLMAADRPTLLAGVGMVNRPEDQSRPPGSEVEPVVFFGDRSILTGPQASEVFAAVIGGRAASYSGGHAAHLEAPQEVAACVEEVLAQVARPTDPS